MHEGTILNNRYRIQKQIRHTDITDTYLADDDKTGKSCVVKHLSLLKTSDVRNPDLFRREARVLSNLDHPSIPRLIDFFEVQSDNDMHIYLVQEFIEGGNLADLIQSGKHFTEKETIKIAIELCDILVYLHSFSPPVIHRDIKPSNIMIASDNTVRLIDFGVVRDNLRQMTRIDNTVIGTYGYMPIEQFGGMSAPASDIYSLGMTLIYILSHLEPAQMEVKAGRPAFRSFVNISCRFAAILEKMTEPELKDRYQDALEVKRVLMELLSLKAAKNVWYRREKIVAISIAIFVSTSGLFFFLKPEKEYSNRQYKVVMRERPSKTEKAESFTNTKKENNKVIEFSDWMPGEELDNYFSYLNKYDSKTNYFEKGHRINAVDGRFHDGKVEFRVAIGETPKDRANWWWWINQTEEAFNEKNSSYKKEGARLVYLQTFSMPDGTIKYQGVWHKD